MVELEVMMSYLHEAEDQVELTYLHKEVHITRLCFLCAFGAG